MDFHKCEKCGRVFDCKGSLKKHMNKKIPCIIPNQSINSKFNCYACNRGFTTNQSLKHHIKNTCQIIKNKKNEEDTNAKVYTEIAELKETVNELKNQLKSQLILKPTINNTTNNTTNNYQINNIIMNC